MPVFNKQHLCKIFIGFLLNRGLGELSETYLGNAAYCISFLHSHGVHPLLKRSVKS